MPPVIKIVLVILRESILGFFGSGLVFIIIISLLLLIIAGVIIATCLWIDVKNAKLKLEEMEK
jgi:hypothetical protein